MRLFLLILSIVFVHTNLDYNFQTFEECFEEINEYKETYEDYYTLEYSNIYEIWYKESKLIEYRNLYDKKVIYENNNLYCFYKENSNDYILVSIFYEGVLQNNIYINNKFIDKFDIYYKNDHFYLFSTVSEYTDLSINEEQSNVLKSQKNIIYLKFTIASSEISITNVKIYGGELNDEYSGSISFENGYIVFGVKDTLSGGDFGNGGGKQKGHIFFHILESGTLIDYKIVLNTINNIEVNNNEIYVFSTKQFYIFDYSLNQKKGFELPLYSSFGHVINNEMVGVVMDSRLDIYDIKNNKVCYNIKCDAFSSISKYIIKDNYIYLWNQDEICKGFVYDTSLKDKTYIYDDFSEINDEVVGFPAIFHLKNTINDSSFNPMVFGVYNFTLDYEYFKIDAKIEVKKRANVSEERVYPIGYHLIFSGEGYLNGEKIANNYEILNEGSYNLLLKGYNETISINFYIEDILLFTEIPLKDWDYEVREGKTFDITFILDKSDYIVNKVIINNEECYFQIDDNVIKISIELKNDISDIYIQRIEFINDDMIYDYNINKKIKVKIIKPKLTFNNELLKEDENIVYKINCDNIQAIKYIKIVSNTTSLILPFMNYNTKVPFTDEDLYVYAGYDVNGKEYEEKFLFMYKINDTSKIKINASEEGKIIFTDPKTIDCIYINNNEVYRKNNYDFTKYLVILIGVVICIIGAKITIKKTKKQKLKNIISNKKH